MQGFFVQLPFLKLKQLLPHLAAMMSRCLLATLLLAVAASAEQHSCLGKLHLNLEKDCKWQLRFDSSLLLFLIVIVVLARCHL